MTRRSRPQPFLAACLVGLVFAGCGGGGSPTAGLNAIPRQDLTRVDASVRDALDEGHRAFDEAIAAGNAAAEDHGRLAMLYHAHEQFAPAEVGYCNAIVLSPDELRWHYLLGRLLEADSRAPEAAVEYARVLELDPHDVPALVQSGNVALGDADHEQADERFRRALKIDADCVPALLGAGKVALARREFREAVEAFERALELSPDSNMVNYPLGLAYRGLGDNDRARDLLAQRGNLIAGLDDPLMRELQDMQVGWRVHQDLGIRLLEEQRYPAALEAFLAAAEAAPDQPSVQTNLGSTLVKLGRLDEARIAFERAILADPHQAVALYDLGVIAARAGDDERALGYYDHVLRSEPDKLSAHFNMANALRRLARFDEAAGHYAAVVAGDPSNELAHLAGALSLVRLERYAEAVDRLEAARVALPDDRIIKNALARLLAAAPVDGVRDGARAMQIAEALLQEERSLPHVETLAMAAAEVGDFTAAQRWQAAAVGAAERVGRTDLLPELRENLGRYQAATPCRRPWHPDDPLLSPGKLRP